MAATGARTQAEAVLEANPTARVGLSTDSTSKPGTVAIGMTTIPAGETTEPRDAADERISLDAWLRAWHALHPGQSHPLDALGSVDWAETMPVELNR